MTTYRKTKCAVKRNGSSFSFIGASMQSVQKYYFSGIGGSGMSALAHVLHERGHWVGGSDRSNDQKLNQHFFRKLLRQGILLYPQTANSLPDGITTLVVSTAIESNNPDVLQAGARGISVQHRAAMLASLFNSSFGIGIAGTSGKSTVTGMVASILDAAGKDPTVVNGGIIKQYATRTRIGNAKNGSSEILVAEVDESDGTITNFFPRIGVITNVSKDHKEISELTPLFQTFTDQTAECLVINGECSMVCTLRAHHALRFGVEGKHDLVPESVSSDAAGSRFVLQGTLFRLRVPGKHNIANALAAIGVGLLLNIPLPVISHGLALFRGIKRRLELVGNARGITVIDDFAHNPDKIAASLATLKTMGTRLIIVFQPHGYGPTRFLKNDLARTFSEGLRQQDMLICLKIYDAGGTADRSITSQDLLDLIHGPQLFYAVERLEAIAEICRVAKPGDVIAVMGARDDTLSVFARKILKALT